MCVRGCAGELSPPRDGPDGVERQAIRPPFLEADEPLAPYDQVIEQVDAQELARLGQLPHDGRCRQDRPCALTNHSGFRS